LPRDGFATIETALEIDIQHMSQSSSLMRMIKLSRVMPALFTKISMRPNCSTA